MNLAMVFVSTKDEQEAEKIANVLLEKKLAACCNIIPAQKSLYWWKGKIEKSNETLLTIKTRKDYADEVIKNIKENHSYETPAIDFVDVGKTSEDTEKWVKDVTSK